MELKELFGLEGKNVVITSAGSGMDNPLVAEGSQVFSYMSGQILYIVYGTTSLWEVGELRKKGKGAGFFTARHQIIA